jgi:DNA-binding transcriptional LysR family regulator
VQSSDRIGRRVKLQDLHILTAVVQAGSMSKAATLLNTTQSTISRSIADLEETVGVRLLDRSAQGVEPNQYGRALLMRSVAAFDEIKQGVQDIQHLSDPSAGELRIGCSPAMSEGIVQAVIERLSKQYPRVAFYVTIAGISALLDALRTRRIELGFGRMSGSAPDDDMKQEELFEDPLVVVAGQDNPWARRRKLALAELVNEPWTWAPAAAVDTRVTEAFRASGVEPPRAAVYAEPINMRIRLAAAGSFLAVVPAYIMRFPARHLSLKVLPVELPTTHGKSGIVTLKNRTLSPLAQLFIDCARALARGDAGSGPPKDVSPRRIRSPIL